MSPGVQDNGTLSCFKAHVRHITVLKVGASKTRRALEPSRRCRVAVGEGAYEEAHVLQSRSMLTRSILESKLNRANYLKSSCRGRLED